jgi:hypothetical protein
MPTSTNTEPKINPAWIPVCKQASQALGDQTPDVLAAVVTTSDGFDVASHIPNDKMSPQQLSAMTSAMLDPAEALVSEAVRSGFIQPICRYNMPHIWMVQAQQPERSPHRHPHNLSLSFIIYTNA